MIQIQSPAEAEVFVLTTMAVGSTAIVWVFHPTLWNTEQSRPGGESWEKTQTVALLAHGFTLSYYRQISVGQFLEFVWVGKVTKKDGGHPAHMWWTRKCEDLTNTPHPSASNFYGIIAIYSE